jgi:hypothetical protein
MCIIMHHGFEKCKSQPFLLHKTSMNKHVNILIIEQKFHRTSQHTNEYNVSKKFTKCISWLKQ